MSDSSQGPGWWLASDGKWYPPESVPQATGQQSPPPSFGTMESNAAPKAQKPWWQRRWTVILGLLVVIFVLAAILASNDKGASTAAEPAEAQQPTTAAEPAEAQQPTTAAEPAEVQQTTTAPNPTATDESDADTAPLSPFEEGCSYRGLDSFDNMQVELRFVNPLNVAGGIGVSYALFDGEGIQFHDSTALVDVALPEEQFRIQDDTFEYLPASATDEGAITCEILEIADYVSSSTPQLSGDEATCKLVEFDSFGDSQVELMLDNPFDRSTDLAVYYALRGPNGVRFHGDTEYIDLVAAGERVQEEVDTRTGLPDWVSESEFTCLILAVADWGTDTE